MSIIYFLIPVTLVLAGGALAVFLWAVRDGQFEDLESPAVRMLEDGPAPGAHADPALRDGADNSV